MNNTLDNMNQLLDFTICSGLYFSHGSLDTRTCALQCPKGAFGVFVTVRRFRTRSTHPQNIHGCIGYWSNDYQTLSNTKLLRHIQRVSYQATHNDPRKHGFTCALTQDSRSSYELHFMMQPLHDVDPHTGVMSNGKKFYNQKYGLIVEAPDGARATFLPNVFPRASWSVFQNHILEKAGIRGDATYRAYTTIDAKKKLYQLFRSQYVQNFNERYADCIHNTYNTFVPFAIVNNRVVVNTKEYVRNCATLYDVLKCTHPSTTLLSRVKRDTKYYLELYKKNPDRMRQASAFLLLVCHALNLPTRSIAKRLYACLDDLEPQFELGEVLIALNLVHSKVDIMIAKQKEMYKILQMKTTLHEEDLFEFNWHAKFLCTLCTTHTMKNRSIVQHGNLLKHRVLKLVQNIDDSRETNYIAVALESLCSLSRVVHAHYDMKDAIVHLFALLQPRYSDGLFAFRDGSCRLDITGHVLQGLSSLSDTFGA